ncbi:MAG TPA: hypothetical protein VIV12_22875 [Streptosporangiaceae bacterium]
MIRRVPAHELQPKDQLVSVAGELFRERPELHTVDVGEHLTYVYWASPNGLQHRRQWLHQEPVEVDRPGRPRPLAALPSGAWKAMAVCAVATVLAAVAAVLSVDPLYAWVWRAW